MSEKESLAQAPPPAPPAGYPYPYPSSYPIDDDEIDLRELWEAVVEHRALVAAITSVSTAIAVAVALLLTPVFRAEVLLAPVASESKAGLAGLAGQFGDLASLVGINLGSGDLTQEAVAALKSRLLTEAFIKDKNLLPVLFEDDWDAEKKRWKHEDPEDIPTLWKAYELFDEDVRAVSIDKKTGLVTLAIEWKDAAQAAAWANELVARVNRQRQLEAIEEAENSIAYLQEQLKRTSTVEVQQAIYRLIETQTKAIMVAKTRRDYAFKIIDPAVPPEEKSRPKRALIVAFGFVLGTALGVLVAFAKNKLVKKI